jgi:hypothetical protein
MMVAVVSSSPKVVDTPLAVGRERLLKLGQAYSPYCTQHKKPPSQQADLKAALTTADALQSPDDGKPFVVCWGVDLNKPIAPKEQPTVVAYEATGANGKRYVLTTARNVVHLSDAEFGPEESFSMIHPRVFQFGSSRPVL